MVKELQNRMKNSRGRSVFWVVLGLLILIVVLMVSSFWFLTTAQKATEDSVYDVSEVYLQELTKQKVSQFQINLENQERQLKIAIATLNAEDTGSKEKLQNCIKETNRVNDFEFFALFDEDGTLYTANDVINDTSQYPFVKKELEKSEVSLEKVNGNNMIMVMVPLENGSFEGRKIIGAAAGINAETFSEKVFTQYDFGRIFCEVIMADGSFVIKTNHEHLKEKTNLFSGLEREAVFGEDFSIDKLKNEISLGRSGVASYYLQDILHYTYYAPIEGTDWYMKTTIHYDLVSNKIDAVRLTMTRNGLVQLGLVVLILFTVFGIYLSVRRKNEKLNYQRIQAEESNRAKSTFLSNMSHDIRTPMNAIIGFTTIAVSHIDNKDQVQDCLQKVLSSSNHLLSLINDILDMSRIESGKVQIKEQDCNISELMHNLVNIIQPQVKAKQLELFIDTFEVANEDVIADPLKLNQVFINLLSNAVKYTPAKGSISFRIIQKTTFRHGYGDYIFVIKDNGIGMSKEFVEHVFEPFERESSTTRSGIEGTGLGMAITKNIVEMMNGTISVESEVGKGSTFTVEISLKLQDIEKNAEQIHELHGLRALVVDDDFNICDSVSKMLKQLGLRSEWTTSGREAVYRAQMAYEEGDSYHTYIVDWQMPEMSGVETARKIRAAVGEEAPIIILTAYDWTDIEEDAKSAGVTAFCAKPLFMSDLKSALLAANNLVDKNEDSSVWSLADFSGKRVLLVEDIELNREIAEVILTESGFLVESAPDGTDAVEMVKRSEEYYYDVILMDIQMPIMNGYEATRTIRTLPRKDVKDMPIIAMTANALEEDKEAAIKNGMNAHIAKPLDIGIFMEVLSRFVK